MKILLVSQYFWPEVGAPQLIHQEWALEMKKLGHEIDVLTLFPNYPNGKIYPGYSNKLVDVEEWNGIKIIRTYTFIFGKINISNKFLSSVMFMFSAFFGYRKLSKRYDVVISHTPPLFTAFPGMLISFFKGSKHVLNIHDLWLEAIMELGLMKKGITSKAMFFVYKLLLRKSKLIFVTTKGAKQKYIDYGIEASKIFYLPNSINVDVYRFSKTKRDQIRAQENWGDDKIICLYHGTHGISQGLSVVIDAANILKDNPSLIFVFIGDGVEKNMLKQRTEELGLTNVLFYGVMPREKVLGYLHASDIGIVHLRDIDAFSRTLPSKLFEFMVNEKPVVIGVRGDASDIVKEANCGLYFTPQSGEEMAMRIQELSISAELRLQLGKNGLEEAEKKYTMTKYAENFSKALI